MPVNKPLSDSCLNQTFRDARTRNGWLDEDVPETLIRATYDLLKLGPTSANQCPARFLWLRSKEAKERLKPHLIEPNQDKTVDAPWTVIVAWDWNFHEKIPQLFPHNPEAKEWFEDEDARFDNGFRNSSLQGAYLIIAARMMGLDCGPMSGFDKDAVNKEFFANDPDMKDWRVNFICNLGYGDDTKLFERSPRFSFEEAGKIL